MWGDLVVENRDTSITTVNLATGATGRLNRTALSTSATDGAVLFNGSGQLFAWDGTTGAAPVVIAPLLGQDSFAVENGKDVYKRQVARRPVVRAGHDASAQCRDRCRHRPPYAGDVVAVNANGRLCLLYTSRCV